MPTHGDGLISFRPPGHRNRHRVSRFVHDDRGRIPRRPSEGWRLPPSCWRSLPVCPRGANSVGAHSKHWKQRNMTRHSTRDGGACSMSGACGSPAVLWPYLATPQVHHILSGCNNRALHPCNGGQDTGHAAERTCCHTEADLTCLERLG